jgi:hypothetical protein
VSYSDTYELLPEPFRIGPGVILPPGGYDYANVRTAYDFGTQRPMSGTLAAERGMFYSGHRTAATVSGARINPTAQLTVEPTVSLNWIDLAEGSFTTRLVGSRLTYTMTPLTFASALIQYSSASNSVSANVRLRWEYRPGSELFVVYNQELDALAPRFPDLVNRSFIVKINRLLRF